MSFAVLCTLSRRVSKVEGEILEIWVALEGDGETLVVVEGDLIVEVRAFLYDLVGFDMEVEVEADAEPLLFREV